MKYIRRISLVFVAVVFLTSMLLPSYAASVSHTDSEPYIYPLTPDSEEWATFMYKSDILDKLQIPSEKLSSMTTEALLTTVLNYPYILDYNFFNSPEFAFQAFFLDFNGFRELMSRSDLTDILISKYDNSEVMTTTQYSQFAAKSIGTSNDILAFPKQFFYPSTIEFLLVCDEIHNGEFSDNQSSKIVAIFAEKNHARVVSGMYSQNSNVLYRSRVIQKATRIGEYATLSSVKTPKGSNVPTFYDRSPDYTVEEAIQVQLITAESYSNAKILRPATVKYNCHSYAWYSQDTSNKHWMDDPSLYMSDGSYYKLTSSARTGHKVYWPNSDHSGIVSKIDYSTGAQVYYVISKWGPAGLYEHMIANCPYTGIIRFYERKLS